MSDNQAPTPPEPLTFLKAFFASAQAPKGTQFSESTLTERTVEELLKRSEVLSTMPLKYLRALITFTDLRILQLTQHLGQASDTMTVAHVRGQMKEMENLQVALRWWLDVRKEQNDG